MPHGHRGAWDLPTLWLWPVPASWPSFCLVTRWRPFVTPSPAAPRERTGERTLRGPRVGRAVLPQRQRRRAQGSGPHPGPARAPAAVSPRLSLTWNPAALLPSPSGDLGRTGATFRDPSWPQCTRVYDRNASQPGEALLRAHAALVERGSGAGLGSESRDGVGRARRAESGLWAGSRETFPLLPLASQGAVWGWRAEGRSPSGGRAGSPVR